MPETREGGRSTRSELWRRRQLDTPPQHAGRQSLSREAVGSPILAAQSSVPGDCREKDPQVTEEAHTPQPSRCTCAPVPALQEDALRAAGIPEKVKMPSARREGVVLSSQFVREREREREKKKKSSKCRRAEGKPAP